MLAEVMTDIALPRSPLTTHTRVVSVGLRRVLASLLVTVVLVGAVAFVGNSSREILQTSRATGDTVSAPSVLTYGWSWWPLGLKRVYSDGTETVELW